MKSRASNQSTSSAPAEPIIEYADLSVWNPLITQVAFVLLLGITIARATMLEMLRDVFEGVSAAPRGATAGTTLTLNLFCCIPALLILLRRAVDKTYVVRFSWALASFVALAVYACASTAWASDKYAAVVTSSTLLAAWALLWAASQLVRSWMRLRTIAGACLGLLLIYTAHGIIHRTIDVPDTIKYWQEHKSDELRVRNWPDGSFEAQQFEKKLLAGEMVGFSASPNTYAAILVVLVLIVSGAAIQRITDHDEWGWPVAMLAIFPATAWVLWYTQSKAAFASPIIGAGMLIALHLFGAKLRERRNVAFWSAVGAFALLVAAVIGHGLYHHGLPTDSLNFRWQYWVGAMRIVKSHPIIGVGWYNFASYYLGVRLPIASEEIKDPHNFLVRTLVELGIVGLLLLIAGMIRLAWELTRSIAPIPPKSTTAPLPRSAKYTALKTISAIAFVAVLINILAGVDLSAGGYFVFLELIKRILYFGLLMLGIAVVTLQSSQRAAIDERPCPWILNAMLVAMLIFLLHNLIDFSFFETGPTMLIAMLIGSLLGVRAPSLAGKRKKTKTAILIFASAALVWIVIAVGFVVPMTQAEQHVQDASDAMRKSNPLLAASLLKDSFNQSPVRNADSAVRAARTYMLVGNRDTDVKLLLSLAIVTDPMEAGYYLTRAQYLLTHEPPELLDIFGDYAHALLLNPNDVPTRIEFADRLAQFNYKSQAKEQYQQALDIDNQLHPDNTKRLSAEKRARITATMNAP